MTAAYHRPDRCGKQPAGVGPRAATRRNRLSPPMEVSVHEFLDALLTGPSEGIYSVSFVLAEDVPADGSGCARGWQRVRPRMTAGAPA